MKTENQFRTELRSLEERAFNALEAKILELCKDEAVGIQLDDMARTCSDPDKTMYGVCLFEGQAGLICVGEYEPAAAHFLSSYTLTADDLIYLLEQLEGDGLQYVPVEEMIEYETND